MKKIFVFILLFSSHSALSSMNNRYGGKDARRNTLINKKVAPQASKLSLKEIKKKELQQMKLATIAAQQYVHQQQTLAAFLAAKQSQLTFADFASTPWHSNYSDNE